MRTPQLADNLRRAVLQAAIEGKLNDRTSEDARDLLAAIQTEKAAQQKTGKQKKNKPLAAISEEEIPFAIPENWVWVRLGEIAEYKKGPFGSAITKSMFIPKGNGAIKVYEQKNAIKKDASLGVYYISKQYFEEKLSGFEVKAGDILVSCAGTIGESYILPDKIEKGIINQALMRIRIIEPINKYMFLLVFDYAIKAANASAKGTAIKNIPPFEILKNLLIPLPPLTEQQQIVAKLTQLLSEIDNLKTQEQALLAAQNAFPKKLRAAILQAAIQGELNERTDENARDLLAAIQAEKAALQKTGKLKKDKPLAAISEEEIPFAIPENWVWVRLGDIFNISRGGSPRPIQQFLTDDENGINWIKIGDTDIGGKYIRQTKEKIIRDGMNKSRFIKADSLLLTNSMSYGRPYILKTDGCIHDGWLSLEPLNENIDREYAFYVISSHAVQSQFHQTVAGAVVKNLNSDKVKETLIPLPPLAEQQQIVAKLEALLAEIDTLENAT
jgi:putative uncharacterized protein (fragment)